MLGLHNIPPDFHVTENVTVTVGRKPGAAQAFYWGHKDLGRCIKGKANTQNELPIEKFCLNI